MFKLSLAAITALAIRGRVGLLVVAGATDFCQQCDR